MAALSAHGIHHAATHVARKACIARLVDRGIQVSKVADAFGHRRIETTTAYLGRGRQMDADVRLALE
jgi:site-specific recombinase XerD